MAFDTIAAMTGQGAASTSPTGAPLAFFWGDDTYGLDAAVEAFRSDPARFPAGIPDRWRPTVDAGDAGRAIAEIVERVATGSMWGVGTVAIVSGVGQLTRRGSDRDSLVAAIATVAPGNGLAIVEETDSGKKDPPAKALADAIRDAGGVVRRLQAPREGALAAWIEQRARERQVALAPGAARTLAGRIGGFVREGDVDRRHQSRIAVMELEKLALRHADGAPITTGDVEELVAEAVPGSMWAFVDAVALRQRQRSLQLIERLFDATPEPVLLAVLHRRIRELIEIRDRLDRGETPGSLVRSMRLVPFRAETLARQAQAWTSDELDHALEGLLELDAQVKGVAGRGTDPARNRLAFDLWITDVVAPA
jgi:DNA polymerase III delta subunit